MYSHTIKIKNGPYLQYYSFYNCDKCNRLMEEAWPIYEKDECHYCPKCAFEKDIIDSKAFVNNVGGISSTMFKAAINPITKEAEITHIKSRFSWQFSNKDYRRTKQYRDWRSAVLKRDKCCQHCGTKKELQAHHIKPFATCKKLRYEVSNGLTLCKKCHRDLHKRLKREGVKYG